METESDEEIDLIWEVELKRIVELLLLTTIKRPITYNFCNRHLFLDMDSLSCFALMSP